MGLFPTWEKSPFTIKRVPEQTTITDVLNEPLSEHGQPVLVSLPTIRPLSHDLPVGVSRSVETSSCQSATHTSTVRFSPCVKMGFQPSGSPQLDLTFTSSPSLLQILDTGSMAGHQATDAYQWTTHISEPPRQTSNCSSTSRSGRSATSSRLSRPSSRSSLEDSESATRHDTTPRPKGFGYELVKQRQQTYSSSVTTTVTSRNSPSRPARLPITTIASNKTQPISPTKLLTGFNETINATRSVGSIKSSDPESPNPRRGARLGNVMLEGFSNQQSPPLRSSLVQSDLPAMVIRHDRNEEPVTKQQPKLLPGPKLSQQPKSVQQPTKSRTASPEVASEVAGRVLLGILQSLTSITDLRSTAMVNKGFYRVFKVHERDLVSRALLTTSPPAWELRHVMQSEQKRGAFKMRSYQRDVATLEALHAFILMKCQHVCRTSTINALIDGNTERKAELDNALWRIWSFCRLFGKDKTQSDIKSQIMWLDGGRHGKSGKVDAFGMGNRGGLSVKELEDMSEMRNCLETLLAGFKGREADARKAGIFDNCVIDENECATERYFLEAWIYELLCLGPKAVLTLSSCSFEQAKVLGITRWTPPVRFRNRGDFLQIAIEEVYRERLVAEARNKAIEFEKELRSRPRPERAISDFATPSLLPGTRLNALRIDTCPVPAEQTTYHRSDSRTESPAHTPLSATSSPLLAGPLSTRPAAFSSLSITTTASARLGATLFPAQIQRHSNEQTQLYAHLNQNSILGKSTTFKSEVLDPVDKAIEYLVKELGFEEVKAKQALAMSDDGKGINIQKAVDLLMIGTEIHTTTKKASYNISELPGSPALSSSPVTHDKQWVITSPHTTSPLQNDFESTTFHPMMDPNRSSIRLTTTRPNSDTDTRESHLSHTRTAMCEPLQPSLPSPSPTTSHPLLDTFRQKVRQRNSTSKYTIGSRRYSHRPTLGNSSNSDEIKHNKEGRVVSPSFNVNEGDVSMEDVRSGSGRTSPRSALVGVQMMKEKERGWNRVWSTSIREDEVVVRPGMAEEEEQGIGYAF